MWLEVVIINVFLLFNDIKFGVSSYNDSFQSVFIVNGILKKKHSTFLSEDQKNISEFDKSVGK